LYAEFGNRSKVNKITMLQEELDAWKAGYKLGKRLGIHIDRFKFEKIKAKCVASYLSYYDLVNKGKK